MLGWSVSSEVMNGTRTEDTEKVSRDVHVKVLFTLFAFAITANTAVIITLLRSRARAKRLSNINFLVLQLVISDLLVAFFCLAADASWKHTYSWNAGDIMCKLVKYLQMFALYSSTFIVVTIAVDRCIAVRYPMHRAGRRGTIRCMAVVAWILAALCSTPQVFIFRVLEAPFLTEDGQPFEQCVTFGAYEEVWQELSYILFTCCAMFIFPLVIITVSYTVIFILIRHELGGSEGTTISIVNSRVSSLRGAAGHQRETLMKKAKSRTLWMSILVIVNFLVCWAPYYIAVLYYVIEHALYENVDQDANSVFQIIFFFGTINSVINPLIYGCFHIPRSRSAGLFADGNSYTLTNNTFVTCGGGRTLLDPETCSLLLSPAIHRFNRTYSAQGSFIVKVPSNIPKKSSIP